jgi:hypothetical protein
VCKNTTQKNEPKIALGMQQPSYVIHANRNVLIDVAFIKYILVYMDLFED